jgi:hypothetical protein
MVYMPPFCPRGNEGSLSREVINKSDISGEAKTKNGLERVLLKFRHHEVFARDRDNNAFADLLGGKFNTGIVATRVVIESR